MSYPPGSVESLLTPGHGPHNLLFIRESAHSPGTVPGCISVERSVEVSVHGIPCGIVSQMVQGTLLDVSFGSVGAYQQTLSVGVSSPDIDRHEKRC